MLTYMNAFKIGDRVKIADVVSKTMFVTRVRTPKNVEITIPNAMVMNNHIINFSTMARTTGLTLHTTVTLGYAVPWPKVHELMVEAGLATDGIESNPRPFVLQTSLDDFYVAYELKAITRQPTRMPQIYSELHQNIQNTLHAGGIEIASPHLSEVRDGNTANLPEDYLPKDYKPGGFRVFPFGPRGEKE